MTCLLRKVKGEYHFFGMSFYRRRLPHWQPEGVPIFLTWRLHGSMPRDPLQGRSQTCPTGVWEGRRFLLFDRRLDAACSGPMFLKNSHVAAAVAETLVTIGREWGLYDLFAWVIMSNHIHVLLQPHQPLRRITHVVKSTSARRANLVLGRVGLRIWQDESYDHWVRDGKELERIVNYIEWNPVRAGLAESVELWPWSSASKAWQVIDLPHSAPNEHGSQPSCGTLPSHPNLR
jgi:REP element-mobilizing transposase RayT